MNLWRNAQLVSSEALAKEDMLRRISPRNQSDRGDKAARLHIPDLLGFPFLVC